MAKTNIVFNNKNYQVEDSNFAPYSNALKSHFSSVMNGSGATINFGGTTYNIDSAKLEAARNAFVQHLGTIAGNGSKVKIGGVEYGIDTAKVAGAVAEIEAVLGGSISGGGSDSFTLTWISDDVAENTFVTLDDTRYVKVSNRILSDAELVGASWTETAYMLSDPSQRFVTQQYVLAINSNWSDDDDVRVYAVKDSDSDPVVFVALVDGAEYNSLVFAEAGTYSLAQQSDGLGCEYVLDLVNSGGNSNPDSPSSSTLEGDGQEFYTLAPTALRFRSTEPLADFQEVKVNGQVVDPSNYTLEEGSTIVNLSIDYLKTLDVGAYDIEVVSANNAPRGGFTVAAPELNEHGFYYNQPYLGYVDAFSDYVAIFLHENGTIDLNFPNTGYVETGSFTSGANGIIINTSLGVCSAIASKDDSTIYSPELDATFTLTDLMVADKEYIYIKTAYGDKDCYRVVGVIDKTKTQYNLIRTGINGLPTLEMVEGLFANNTNLISIEITNGIIYIPKSAFNDCTSLANVAIPSSVTGIMDYAFEGCTKLTSIIIPATVDELRPLAFGGCTKLTSITFEGTVEQWDAISLYTAPNYEWNHNVPATHVQCTDGQVAL